MKSLEKFFSFFKYVLWIIFAFIIVNLFVGLVKYKSVSSYIEFLNTRERNDVSNLLSFEHPNSIFSIFWEQSVSTWDVVSLTGNATITWAILTGDILSWTVEEASWDAQPLDPYDPAFQEEFFDSVSGDTVSLDTETSDTTTTDFWFTTNTWNWTSSNKWWSDILKYIEQQSAQ